MSKLWLILPGVGDDIQLRTSCTFFVATNRTFSSGSLPALDGARCVGSNAGWLAMANDFGLDIEIWNTHNDFSRHTVTSPDPLTWEYIYHDIQLQPQVPCCRRLKPSPPIQRRTRSSAELENHLRELHRTNRSRKHFHIRKVLLCSSKTVLQDDFIALAIYDSKPALNLAYMRAGDEQWTFLDTGISYLDITHRDGKFYGLTNSPAQVKVFDFTTVSPNSPPETTVFIANHAEVDRIFSPFGCFHHYLAFSVSGEPLLIVREMGLDENYSPVVKIITRCYIVLRHNPHNAAGWERVDDLKRQSIFIGSNNAMSISCTNWPGLKSNCIYFTDSPSIDSRQAHNIFRSDVGVFDMETQRFESCAPPNTRLNWPPPVWFQPQL